VKNSYLHIEILVK